MIIFYLYSYLECLILLLICMKIYVLNIISILAFH